MTDYTVVEENPNFMHHEVRRQRLDALCDGCSTPLPGEFHYSTVNKQWMCGAMLVGPYVTEITDRSGSAYGVVHRNDAVCIDRAIESYELEW